MHSHMRIAMPIYTHGIRNNSSKASHHTQAVKYRLANSKACCSSSIHHLPRSLPHYELWRHCWSVAWWFQVFYAHVVPRTCWLNYSWTRAGAVRAEVQLRVCLVMSFSVLCRPKESGSCTAFCVFVCAWICMNRVRHVDALWGDDYGTKSHVLHRNFLVRWAPVARAIRPRRNMRKVRYNVGATSCWKSQQVCIATTESDVWRLEWEQHHKR